MPEYEVDEDGLPRSVVGEWALEKHERLRKYVDITRATRRKYTVQTSSRKYLGGAAYIDLFAGPGRARVRESPRVIDGSPVIAAKAAIASTVPFTEMHVADADQRFCDAAVQRVQTAGGVATGYAAPAEAAAKIVVAKLNPNGLHFAFLDPYNLEGLTFAMIKQLSMLHRVDILLHLSVADLQRNLDRYSGALHSPLDEVAPGWRTAVDLKQSATSLRAAYVAYWQNKMHELGFTHRGVELVTGRTNQRLYWLVFLSRSEFANDLWDKIRYISGQGQLGL
ncbi:MAG TPA: three-Cys-motif partner protein TcmP [Rhizomicrobium sp.]|nr:three-Cys-motif partner protein TcmP [Rhizomicrobium sp.]